MRTYGKIGHAVPTNMGAGVWEDVITEEEFIGDVLQRTEAFDVAGSVLPGYRTTTSVSVLSGGVTRLDEADLRYVLFRGMYWTVATAVSQWPRVVLYLGEEYHGPRLVSD